MKTQVSLNQLNQREDMDMLNLTYKRELHPFEESNLLIHQIDIKNSEDRSWFWEFMTSILDSPDLDYSQFEQLESKRTRQQMERGGHYRID
jgi:hypothetical protein